MKMTISEEELDKKLLEEDENMAVEIIDKLIELNNLEEGIKWINNHYLDGKLEI